jgi:hypothetical protein
MTITVFIKKVFLAAALSQALLLTTCEEFRQFSSFEESETSTKTVFIKNIPSSIEISQEAKDLIMAESHDNPAVSFRQEATGAYIETDGIYLMAVFFMELDDEELVDYILGSKDVPEDVTKNGLAFAMMKISGGTARGRIISLSSDIDEFGYYWKGGDSDSEYGIATLLITPDARFILQADFFLGGLFIEKEYPLEIEYAGYNGTLPEYELNFEATTITIDEKLVLHKKDEIQGSGGYKLNVFEGYGNGGSLPSKMLTDNFVEDIMDRFS